MTLDPKAMRRVMKAFDENRLLCETCNVRMAEYHGALIESKIDKSSFVIAKCKQPTACAAAAAVQALRDGPPKRRKPA